MDDLMKIKKILNKYKNELKNKYGVKKLSIFGSYAKGIQRENSDIDIIVDFYKDKKTFDNYMNLKIFLENLLKKKVDLITRNAIKPKYRKYIEQDLIDV